MTPAPLQLLDYWATSVRMDACGDFRSNQETKLNFDSLIVRHHIKRIDETDAGRVGTRWLVELTIEQEPDPESNIPYTFSLTLQGLVLALPSIPEERLEIVVNANGPAMLFGAAREMVRAITGRGPFKAVIIPSTNFLPQATAGICRPAAAPMETPSAPDTPQPAAKPKPARKKAPRATQ